MSDLQFRDISAATALNPLTEAELALWRQKEGARIVRHCGRYWQETPRGFFSTVHLMARLTAEEATRPSALSWGFQSTLTEAGLARSNGCIPTHVLTDLGRFDLQNLPKNRRGDLKQCLKKVRIVELTGPQLLREQGWEVVADSLRRVHARHVPARDAYQASLDSYLVPERRLILAGLVDSRLAGYIVCYAVDGTAYVERAYYATELLPTNVSTGLLYEFVQICRRCPGIREVVHGLHTAENPGLTRYKTSLGFVVSRLPARVEINPIIAGLLRWRRPATYYRFTGRVDHLSRLAS
jgi:hypothetical protein